MKIIRLAAILLLLAALTACAKQPTVTHSFDWKADFSGYRSWFWLDGKPALMDELLGADMTDQFIRRAITQELTNKGLAVRADEPDLLVKFTSRYQEAVSATPGSLGYSYQWRWVREGEGKGEAQSYGRGTLIIDLIDRKTGALVWQGTHSGAITDERDAQAKIPGAVQAILAQYPPNH